MDRRALTIFALLTLLLLPMLAPAAPTTVVLAVEGMTWGPDPRWSSEPWKGSPVWVGRT